MFVSLEKKKLKKKKPDAVAWDDKTESFVANILPYATSVSGPVIEVPNVDAFKQKGVTKASQILQTEWKELQEKMKAFAAQAQTTQRVYQAHFKFEPIVGETYFLYKGEQGDFLSIIPPDQWKKEFVGAFKLSSEFTWEAVAL